jgi:hypothetical protein
MTTNIIIDLFDCRFDIKCGGITVQFELCKLLCELGMNAKIKSNFHIKNHICNNYYNNEFPIDENVVAIYGETIKGNPLNAKNVIRWILAPLGFYFNYDTVNTWGKSDLVYYFNSEPKFYDNPEKLGSIYKFLNCFYINPYAKQTNFEKRTGICYTIRKAHQIHKGGFKMVHPSNSFEIPGNYNQLRCIEVFNKYEWFMCYDSLTFYIIIAALCGCIPVVYKVDGLSKEQWIQTTAAAEYCRSNGINNLYGIAYGREDMKYAQDTIHLVKEQWDNILEFNREKTIVPFINDVNDFNNMQNTIEKNYF